MRTQSGLRLGNISLGHFLLLQSGVTNKLIPAPWPQRGCRHHLCVNCGYVKGWWLHSSFALGHNHSPNPLREASLKVNNI